MDKLKELLNQKKAQMAGQKTVKIGDVEKQKADKYYQEQQEIEKIRQEKLLKQLEEEEQQQKSRKKVKISDEPIAFLEKGDISDTKDQVQEPEKEPPISYKEIIKRLRARSQPITLFGETNAMRYERLLKLEKESLDHVKHEEHANIFQKDLNMNEDEFKKIIDIVDEDISYEKLAERLEKNKKRINFDPSEYKGRKKESLSEGISNDEKCDDVLYWCKKVLKDWDRELEV